MTSTQTKGSNLNASQRLELLENITLKLESKVNALERQMDVVAQEIGNLSQVITSLAKRTNAILEAGNRGDVNSSEVEKVLIENENEMLKAQVMALVEQNALIPTEEGIDEDSFFVGREVGKQGEVIASRVQIAFSTLKEEAKEKLAGKKVGDLIDSGEVDLEITEVYKINKESK